MGCSTRRLEAVVAAFQRHWRQEKVDGVADASTITTLRDLLALTAPVARRLTPYWTPKIRFGSQSEIAGT